MLSTLTVCFPTVLTAGDLHSDRPKNDPPLIQRAASDGWMNLDWIARRAALGEAVRQALLDYLTNLGNKKSPAGFERDVLRILATETGFEKVKKGIVIYSDDELYIAGFHVDVKSGKVSIVLIGEFEIIDFKGTVSRADGGRLTCVISGASYGKRGPRPGPGGSKRID